MLRGKALIIIGALVALAPFVGVPMSWLAFVLPVLGIATLAVGVSLPGRAKAPTQSHGATA